MNCTNCRRPLNEENLCPRCDLKQVPSTHSKQEKQRPGEQSAVVVRWLGAAIGILGFIGAFYLFFTIGLVDKGGIRKEIDFIGATYSMTLLITSVFWWALAKAIAAGVENTIWIRDKLSENQD